MADRISSLDSGYSTGDLSLYPLAVDSTVQLYDATNNAVTKLARGVTYSSKYLIVDDTSLFPDTGLVSIAGKETVYYGSKTANSFRDLTRGYAGSLQAPWSAGVSVEGRVFAEIHNAKKDAVINIETNLGLEENPDKDSLHGLLKSLEDRFLAPKAVFKASITKGSVPLRVQFQNFSLSNSVKFLWDFGDGGTSVEYAPAHTYLADGTYTVKLNVITTTGAMGISTKKDYISVDPKYTQGYFYVSPAGGSTATNFTFVDQTPGEVVSRYWQFGDGESATVLDPDVHTTTHTYEESGTYDASVMLIFSDNRLVQYKEQVIVS